jgi:predicted kinase
MHVVILRGPSGSGKTRYTDSVAAYAVSEGLPVFIFSADHHMVDEENKYSFDANRLSECHDKCLKNYVETLQREAELCSNAYLIVDNTNTRLWEMIPYVALARSYRAVVEVVTLVCDPAVAWKRNQHGTPADVVYKQHLHLQEGTLQIPSSWHHTLKFVS